MPDFEPQAYGRYYLVERVARGGMAEIFAARRVSSTSGRMRRVAIKRILPELQSKAVTSMFVDEARILSVLEHPHVVRIFDFGREEEAWYIVMEWVEGVTLKDLLRRMVERRRRLPVEFAVTVAQALAGALDHAHHATDKRGRPLDLVHRDLSPSNVLLDYSGLARLTDFGIARARLSRHKTEAGQVKGTFRYMSPEQVAGGEVDQRSDLFSFGIVLWEMLTTKALFRAGSGYESMRLIREGEIHAPASLNPAVPRELDALVMQCLQRDPDARPGSAAELAQRLEAFVPDRDGPTGAEALGHALRRLFAAEFDEGQRRLDRGDKVARQLHHGVVPVPEPLLVEPTARPTRDREALREVAARMRSLFGSLDGEDEGGTGRLLLVEHDPGLRAMLASHLAEHGHAVEETGVGSEAVSILRGRQVDLVVLDLGLPGEPNGLELLDTIRRRYGLAELPVIGVVARDGDVRTTALQMGANDLVERPVELALLDARVETNLVVKLGLEALRVADGRYRALSTFGRDAVVQLTPEGILSFVSPGCEALVGLRPEAMEGRALLAFLHPHDRVRLRSQSPDTPLRSGGPHRVRLRHRDGRWVAVELELELLDEAGAPGEMQGVLRPRG